GGQLYNYYLNTEAEPPIYSVFAIEGGKGRILANITDAPPAYIHSVFSTESFVVLIVWQCDIGPTDKPTYNLIDAIMPWDPEREALFYVIRKDDGEVVARYTAPAFFTFHEINSFEKDGDIIVDLPWMANHTWVEALRLGDFRAHIARSNATASFDVPGTFQRFRLSDFANGKTENGTLKVREALVDFSLRHEVGNIELPKINEEYLHKEYRYAYGTHIEKRGYFMDSIIKIDTKTQTSNVWSPETNHVPSEPIFVSRPGAECEDDGVLLTVALDEATRVSSLVVIDAKEMVEIGRARLPIVMGFGFHGIWGGN
ncbi:RPE65-domain-containing protein, partial [Corynespora cassiicola Philippines]